MAVDISAIMKQLTDAQTQANTANEARYSQGLSTLQTGLGTARGLFSQARSALQNVGQSAASDINLGAKRSLASGKQNLISAGLGNTTITGSLQRGVEADRRRAMTQSEESLAQLQSGLATQEAGAELGAAGSLASFMASRNDVGPDLGLYANLLQQASSSPTGEPVTVRTLGPLAQAGLSATGQPFKYTGGGGGGSGSFSQSSRTASGGGGASAPAASGGVFGPGANKTGLNVAPGISSGMAAPAAAPAAAEAPAGQQPTPEQIAMYKRWKGGAWNSLIPDWARRFL